MDIVTEMDLDPARRDLAALVAYHAERTAVPCGDRLTVEPTVGTDWGVGSARVEWHSLTDADVAAVLAYLGREMPPSHEADHLHLSVTHWPVTSWRPGWNVLLYVDATTAERLRQGIVAGPAEDLVERLRRDA